MTETKAQTAVRLVSQARVRVIYAGAIGFKAEVRGDTGLHVVEWERGRWRCSCPHLARTVPCSHILAANLAWVPPRERAV